MLYLNEVSLLGNIGKVAFRQFGQTPRCEISLATSRMYKKADGTKIENTQWHTIVTWAALAEQMRDHAASYKKMLVKGELRYGEYAKEDGTKVKFTEIVASDISLIEKKQGETLTEPQMQYTNVSPKTAEVARQAQAILDAGINATEDNVPF